MIQKTHLVNVGYLHSAENWNRGMIALLFVIFEIQKESLATSSNTYQTAGSNLKILLFVHILICHLHLL